MFTVDKYYGKKFIPRTYTCWDFTREVWMDLTGQLLSEHTEKDLPLCLSAYAHLSVPVDPCIVFMARGRCTPHVGVYVARRVLHLHERLGARFEILKIATMGFNEVNFYRTRDAIHLANRESVRP